MRLDQYVAQQENISRNRAQMLIRQGSVSVGGSVVTSVSHEAGDGDEVVLADSDLSKYVSRSALKLKYFLDDHPEIEVGDHVCLDVGASTGGFTQILLEKGAKKVYALDVGRDQLHELLLGDERVVSMEGMDVRDLLQNTKSPLAPLLQEGKQIGLVTVDVSFISLEKILPDLSKIVEKFGSLHTQIILLWKPQFEVGRNNLTKKGVVKHEKIQHSAFIGFQKFLQKEGVIVIHNEPSRVRGEEGNREVMLRVQLG